MATKSKKSLHPILIALPVLAVTGLAVLGAYIAVLRQMGKPWVPFPLNLILSEHCAKTFFLDLDILNKECLKITISKGLGYLMIIASAGLKLPIVKNMIDAGTPAGLSTSSLALESVALAASFTASIKKENPFSLWGEVLIIFIQNLAIMLLCLQYTKGADPSPLVLVGIVGYTAAILALPIEANLLIAFATLIAILSRLPQLYANFKQKHTGVLSILTCSLQVLGVTVRLATIAVETGDLAQILSYGLSFLMNTCILIQVIIYWDNTKRELAKSKKDVKSE